MANLRYEIKMVAQAHVLYLVRSWIVSHPAGFITAYPSRRVNNIYFDTCDFQSLEYHVSGTVQRNKVRFRWYGDSLDKTEEGILEVKHKRDRVSWKESVPISFPFNFTTMPWREIVQKLRDDLPPGTKLIFDGRHMPIFINTYLRDYYVSPTTNVRVTLDYEHKAFEQLHSSFPRFNATVVIPATVVIEFKATRADSHHLIEVLDKFPLRPTRNSKFVNCAYSLIT